jgi:hypothetical protein
MIIFCSGSQLTEVEASLLGKRPLASNLKTADPKCNDDLFACGSLLILPFCVLPIPRPQPAGGSESARKKALAKWLLTPKSADPKCNDDLFACGSLLIHPFCDLPIPRPQQVEAILLGKRPLQSGF